MKRLAWIVGILAVLLIAAAFIRSPKDQYYSAREVVIAARNGSYKINPSSSIFFKDGVGRREASIPFAGRESISLLGQPVTGDIDGDGDTDAVIMFTMSGPGSGTFYYVAAMVNEKGVYDGTDAIFVGDRIVPQSIEIHDGETVVHYLERNRGDAFTTPPSVPKELRLAFTGGWKYGPLPKRSSVKPVGK